MLHIGEQYLWMRFFNCFFLFIPSSTFHEQSVDINTICWSFGKIVFSLIWDNNEIKFNMINSNNMLSCIVLSCSCKERLCEEETRNPECFRCTIINPLLHKVNSFKEVYHPRSKRFKWWISSLMPNFRNLIIEETCAYVFKFKR